MYTAELWERFYVMAAWGCHCAFRTSFNSKTILRNCVHVEMTEGLVSDYNYVMDSHIFMSFIIIRKLSMTEIGNSCVYPLVYITSCR